MTDFLLYLGYTKGHTKAWVGRSEALTKKSQVALTYCRLVVPTSLRDAAGRRQLTRSLQTDDHNTALRRYGGVLQELEKDLQRLLSEPSLR